MESDLRLGVEERPWEGGGTCRLWRASGFVFVCFLQWLSSLQFPLPVDVMHLLQYFVVLLHVSLPWVPPPALASSGTAARCFPELPAVGRDGVPNATQVLRYGTGAVNRASCLQFGNGLRDILSSKSREFELPPSRPRWWEFCWRLCQIPALAWWQQTLATIFSLFLPKISFRDGSDREMYLIYIFSNVWQVLDDCQLSIFSPLELWSAS